MAQIVSVRLAYQSMERSAQRQFMIYFTTALDFLDICEMADCSPLPFHVAAPADVWREIMTDYADLRRTIAMNKTIPESIIRILAADENPEVRSRIAHKRATPPDVQIELAEDPSDFVRVSICRNPKVPRKALEILTQDAVDWIVEEAQERLDELYLSGD